MLKITNLTLSRGDKSLFAGLSLAVDSGEIVTVAGVSGSGKSTLLNWMIGDLDPAFAATGELWLNDSRRDTLPIEARRIGILFQDDLLFPHLSVGQNLAFALALADYAYVMSKGRIVHQAPAAELWQDAETKARYLGV